MTAHYAVRVPGDLLLRPVVIVAVAVLALNDHVLKTAAPGFVTGKLSDVAGLAMFPFLVAAIVDIGVAGIGRRIAIRPVLAGAAVATGVLFAIAKTTAFGADLVGTGLGAMQWVPAALLSILQQSPLPSVLAGRIVVDPTDLLALPALLVPLRIARQYRASAPEVT